MPAAPRFKCPICGFTVFNRRLSTCESCKTPLPADRRFSDADVARIQADSIRIDQTRRAMADEAAREGDQ